MFCWVNGKHPRQYGLDFYGLDFGLWIRSIVNSLIAHLKANQQTLLNAIETIGDAIRQHWSIENRHHYARNVSFFEDQSRIRNKPGHAAT